ncbi:hypothetical protein LXL04_019906 [Taraxacum kok-saghyz]
MAAATDAAKSPEKTKDSSENARRGFLPEIRQALNNIGARKLIAAQSLPKASNANNPTPNVCVTENQSKKARTETSEFDLSTVEQDSGLHIQIYDYPVNQQRVMVRRTYMNLGPFQPILSSNPKSGPQSHKRSFQVSLFKSYPWLEYSESLDAAFCILCFLFNKPCGMGYYGHKAFTNDGFRNWKHAQLQNMHYIHHQQFKKRF